MREFLQKFTNLELRVLVSMGVAFLVFLAIPETVYSYRESHFLWSWNAGVASFLFLTGLQMMRITNQKMRHHIQPETIRRWMILTTLIIASCGSLLAIFSLLQNMQSLPFSRKTLHFIVSGTTLVLSWLMLHTVFTLEYAYQYYHPQYRKHYPGYEKLEFPHEKNPNYWDFLYFSVGIGMASQVADTKSA